MVRLRVSLETVHQFTFRAQKVFGFTRSGTSELGKHARRVLNPIIVKRLLGVVIVGFIATQIMFKNVANTGGASLLNPAALSTPKATIDAYTQAGVQAPLDYDYESRGYSLFHSGVDLVAPIGTTVEAIMPGSVEAVIYDSGGYGTHVIVKHDGELESLYAHLSHVLVKEGDKVDLDTVLAKSGNTGNSTGPHLHLEIYQDGQVVNPADIVPTVN